VKKIRYRYNKEKLQFEAWLVVEDDPWFTPLLVGTFSEKSILETPLPARDAVKRWEDAVHDGTGIYRG
jgi:hypothetical protein